MQLSSIFLTALLSTTSIASPIAHSPISPGLAPEYLNTTTHITNTTLPSFTPVPVKTNKFGFGGFANLIDLFLRLPTTILPGSTPPPAPAPAPAPVPVPVPVPAPAPVPSAVAPVAPPVAAPPVAAPLPPAPPAAPLPKEPFSNKTQSNSHLSPRDAQPQLATRPNRGQNRPVMNACALEIARAMADGRIPADKVAKIKQLVKQSGGILKVAMAMMKAEKTDDLKQINGAMWELAQIFMSVPEVSGVCLGRVQGGQSVQGAQGVQGVQGANGTLV